MSSFHSISFPSEWGLLIVLCVILMLGCFHSISFPSEWGRLFHGWIDWFLPRFHSISFPSEWGLHRINAKKKIRILVSIQLVSPASGDILQLSFFYQRNNQFPFN